MFWWCQIVLMFLYKKCLAIHSHILATHSILYVFQEAEVGNTTAGSVAARRDVIGDNAEPTSDVQAASQQGATVPDHGYMVSQ